MKVREYNFKVPITFTFTELAENIARKIPPFSQPVRFVVTHVDGKYWHCEVAVIEETSFDNGIFDFVPRSFERTEKMTVVAIIPTGIGAEVGGDSGDGQAVMRLLASVSDRLITHPNTVNGADIIETTANMLYVEGSTLARFFMGSLGLLPTRANRILLAVDKRMQEDGELTSLSINAASAARMGLGANIDVVIIESPPIATILQSESGRAAGVIEGIETWYEQFAHYQNDYDAFGISSLLFSDSSIYEDYFAGKISVNPWGGIEAILTHSLSLLLNRPIAHSPMYKSMEEIALPLGVVNPEMAAEAVSKTYLHCILKGLHTSPRLITRAAELHLPGVLNAADVNCLVIPERCLGIPTLAALLQGIKVIVVRDHHNVMKVNLNTLPWKRGQLIQVENYAEAAGVIAALKGGISLDSIQRPVLHTRILEAKKEGILVSKEVYST